jgi:hypothetical protein
MYRRFSAFLLLIALLLSPSFFMAPKPALAANNQTLAEASPASPASLPPGTILLPASLVQTVNTSAWDPPAPDPSGVDYWPLTGRLLVADGEVDEMPEVFTGDNIFDATTSGKLVSTCSTTDINRKGWSNEASGLAINPDNNRIYLTDDDRHTISEVGLGPDGVYCTADDTLTTVHFGSGDIEDVAYGNNMLFLAYGVAAEVYQFSLGPDGLLGGGDDGPVTHWDTASLGFSDLEGIGYNFDNGTLFLSSLRLAENYLGEASTSGTLLRAYDLSFISGSRSDVAYGPSSRDPAVKSVYIVSRGVDNRTNPEENDGKWWEISLGGGLTGSFGKIAPQNGATSQATNPTLSWESLTSADNYELCYDTTNDGTCANWTNNGLSTSADLSGLAANTTYYWHVRAQTSSGMVYSDNSATAFWSFSTATELPPTWIGSAQITSNRNVVAVARPHLGLEIASYDAVSTGGLSAYLPMLFKGAFGGSYNAEFQVENVDPANTAHLSIQFYDALGHQTCSTTDTVGPLASTLYSLSSQACLPAGWVGSAVVRSDQPIIVVVRPQVGGEMMTYNGFSSGSLQSSLPMLFKAAWTSYNSAFYVQNVDAGAAAHITIHYIDWAGQETCSISDTVEPLASKGYWVPAQSCLPQGWVGGVIVNSDVNIVSVARPHIGTQVTTYSGFSTGSLHMYVPMQFKKAMDGSYDTALYVQNVDPSHTASLSIEFVDNNGNITCSMQDTLPPSASRGYWGPTQFCLPDGWAGGAVISSDRPVAAVARSHIGDQAASYPGIGAGSTSLYLPMLFKDALNGAYDAAFYIQNTDETNPADVTITLYDVTGNVTCTSSDTIPARGSRGYWLPTLTCQP